MTQDEIIKMARQAGIKRRTDEFYSEFCDGVYFDDLEAFAKLVAAKAIAELESQEPVATVTSETGADITMSWWHEPALPIGTKLYTHPPQRTWVGLTIDEREQIQQECFGKVPHHVVFAHAIEAKLKGKNHG